jgi:hypothetical protein
MRIGRSFIIVVIAAVVLFAWITLGTREQVQPPPQDGQPTPVSFSDVDQALQALAPATIAFNAPPAMRFGESRPVGVLVSLTMTQQALVDELRRRVPRGGEIAGENIDVSPFLEVRLSGGEGFDVVSISPARQAVAERSPTEWRWNVTPRRGGVQHLHLTVDAILLLRGESVPRMMRTFDHTISVQISLPQRTRLFVADHWQWLATTLLIPLGGYLWRRFRRKQTGRRAR